jgi:hypothetical protein
MLAILLLALLQSSPVLPDPELTPGRVRQLTREQICTTHWGVDRRFVTEAMKRHVFRAYGIAWARRGEFEVDHLVPRSLGGADDILNLWPQPWAGDQGARKKDRLEVVLGDRYCLGEVPLRTAQRAFVNDWTAAYRRYVKPRGHLTEEK